MGCILSRDPSKRGMGIKAKGNAHKYFGTEGSEVSFNVISQENENESSSFSNQQHNSLDVLTKNGGTGNKRLLDLAKDIWDYILKNGITITAEYLTSYLNVEADWQSSNPRHSSEWKLLPQIFH